MNQLNYKRRIRGYFIRNKWDVMGWILIGALFLVYLYASTLGYYECLNLNIC